MSIELQQKKKCALWIDCMPLSHEQKEGKKKSLIKDHISLFVRYDVATAHEEHSYDPKKALTLFKIEWKKKRRKKSIFFLVEC